MRIGSLELRREDFPDLSNGERTDRLLRQLNRLGSELLGMLNHGLTFADNFAAEVRTVDVTTRDEWVTPTLQNSWVWYGAGYATPGFRAEPGGVVRLHGLIKSGTVPSAAFTLPVGYRPDAPQLIAAVANEAFARVQVNTNGEVHCLVGSNVWFSLDGITFPVPQGLPPNPAFPVRLKSSIVPTLVFVGAAWDVTDKNETPVSLGSVAWSRSQKGDEIVISGIGGVSANRKYRVKLVIAAG